MLRILFYAVAFPSWGSGSALPAGASVEITATDSKSYVVDVLSGYWPARTRNIASGDSQPFNFGPAMKYRPEMKKFDIKMIEARTWR